MTPRRWAHVVVVLGLFLALLLSGSSATLARPAEPGATAPHPTDRVIGRTVYGRGTASSWAGPGAARNDCLWPWTACTTIEVVALDTGLRIVVTPTMYCDCYTGRRGPNGERQRIVDLDPAQVAALGLNPAEGLWPVRVRPVSPTTGLPDTAMEDR